MIKKEINVNHRLDYRPPDFTINKINLTFNLDAKKTRVTAIHSVVKQNVQAANLILDGENLTLQGLKVNGAIWNRYELKNNKLILYQVPDTFTLTIINQINPRQNTALEGLYQSGHILCTQCEAEGFRRITYYLDRPDVLAIFTVTIYADKGKYPVMLSNGNCVAKGELANGWHWIKWHDPFPKPCYLFALVAGCFDVMEDHFVTASGRRVKLQIYLNKGDLNQSKWAMQCLKKAMKWDEERFGLEYDLDIFMIVAVDFFNMGAMENKGLNIFNAKYILADPKTATDDDYLSIESVIGHEYFHNWTGNRVTCRDWFQLSLKEGLTVFRDQEFSADLGARSVNRIHNVQTIRSLQFAEDASPMAHPIRPEKFIEINNFYTVTVYEKGAEVVRMMHTLLGEERFCSALRCYLRRYDGSYATCDDFVQVMEAVSGIDLTQFRQWYSQSGTPEVSVTSHYKAAAQQYKLTITQQTAATADQKQKYPLHLPIVIGLYDNTGQAIPLQHQGISQSPLLNVTGQKQTFVFDNVPHKPVISLLHDFSAPVKVHYNYQLDELLFLVRYATDDFSRYDAVQMLYYRIILKNIDNVEKDRAITGLPDGMKAVLQTLLSESEDKALTALIFTPPSENEIANRVTLVNPDIINRVHRHLISELANTFIEEWLTVYQANQNDIYHISHTDIAQRKLKNTSLFYIAHSARDELANQLVNQQYQRAHNMTDRFAALLAAVKSGLSCVDQLMSDFDNQWYMNGMVMDKWFTLQAISPSSNVLKNIKKLLSHRSFNMNNPNRVRSLVGAFSVNNPVAFHAATGEGYQFLTAVITALNDKNPQIAAKLVDPFIRFKCYDNQRQRLMKLELEKLLSLNSLGCDLYEKISKALVL